MNVYLENFLNLSIAYIPKVLLALLVLVVGWKVAGWIGKILDQSMKKKGLEATVRKFLSSILSVALKTMVIISVISMLGVQTTSFIAVLGAAGLAVGFALQGSLSNFAGGVLIAIFKPFVVGDYIDAQGYQGTVREVSIFNTILKTPDNQKVIIPNGALSNGTIVNVTVEPTRRVDMMFGIGYEDDIKKASDVLTDIVTSHPKVLKDPAPQVRVKELADSSVNFICRPWVKTEDYWEVYFGVTEEVKRRFDKEGISIPYPQRDVHLHQS